MIAKLLVTFLVSVVIGVNSANTHIKRCRAEDTICARESAQELLPILAMGVPQLGIEASDPLHFDEIDLSKGKLNLVMKDITVRGIEGCTVKRIERDVATSKISISVQCYIDTDGDYEMSGEMLLVPVYGKGKAHMFMRKIELNVEGDLQEIYKDGKKHWDIKSWTHNFDVKKKSDLIFEDIFDRNMFLELASRAMFRANWKKLIIELGPPIVKAVTEHVIRNTNAFFHAIPIDDLVLS